MEYLIMKYLIKIVINKVDFSIHFDFYVEEIKLFLKFIQIIYFLYEDNELSFLIFKKAFY